MRDTKAEVLHFWFDEAQPQQWFQKNDDFDNAIRQRFLTIYEMAADGLCDSWRDDPAGCVALCVVLDQFPRNMFRGNARAFATDSAALLTAKFAVAKGFDLLEPVARRRFIYLPYEHSESLSDQNRSVELFGRMREQDPMGYDYALRHREVIEKFGRFPHRNAALGRASTPEEESYLATPGAGF
jgi:uncharacterized protein (DUF924 family)